jgi:hypothetical protein
MGVGMPYEIGQRVGAISHGEGDTIWIFGFGVYEGDHVPPAEAGGFNFGHPNPRIRLDSGKHVYGCECWWGSEAKIREQVSGKTVVEVDIDEARAAAAG